MIKLPTKFAVSVHILSTIYLNPDVKCTSDYIAGSVNTNPVVIRRLVGKLKQNGLVHVTPGASGIFPVKPPEDVSLYDIFSAINDDSDNFLFGLHENTNVNCFVGANINKVLKKQIARIQSSAVQTMREITMSDIIIGIQEEVKKKELSS